MGTFHFSKDSLEPKVQEKLNQALTTWQLWESGVSGQEYSKLFLVILDRWKPRDWDCLKVVLPPPCPHDQKKLPRIAVIQTG